MADRDGTPGWRERLPRYEARLRADYRHPYEALRAVYDDVECAELGTTEDEFDAMWREGWGSTAGTGATYHRTVRPGRALVRVSAWSGATSQV